MQYKVIKEKRDGFTAYVCGSYETYVTSAGDIHFVCGNRPFFKAMCLPTAKEAHKVAKDACLFAALNDIH